MNIKQILRIAAPVLVIASLFVSLTGTVDSAAALSDQKCTDKYQGKSAPQGNYNGDKCDKSKGGPCTVESAGPSASADRYDCNGSLSSVDKSSSTTMPADASPDPVAGDDCGGVKTAIIKCDAKNSGDITDNGVWALLLLVLNVLTAGVGIIAVAGIVYGAILYTTAEDKADQVKKATDIITNVVIGLILFALMYALLNYIVPGGVFA